jgi:hypothetical protein
VAFIEPAFSCAVVAAPGLVAGIGLPALAIIGLAYWVGRKVGRRKNWLVLLRELSRVEELWRAPK